MSTIIKINRKSGPAYRIQYYLEGRRHYLNFPPGIDPKLIKAKQNELNSQIALHKAGIKIFIPDQPDPDTLQLQHFSTWYRTRRQREQNIAPSTLDRYCLAINIFTRTIGPKKPLAQIQTADIETFKTCQLSQGKSKIGINKNLHHLKNPFTLAHQTGLIPQIPTITKFKTRQQTPDFLLPHELDLLEKHMPKGQSQLAFQIIKWTGIRRTELVDRCYKKDFDFARKTLLIRGKNNINETVPLTDQLISYLKTNNIFNARRPDDNIITLSKSQISWSIAIAKKRAGIKRKGRTHLLRHSLGCYLINNGFGLEEIKKILRHKTLYMTLLYSQILDKKLTEKFSKIKYK